MNQIEQLKENFEELIRLCLDIPSVILQDAATSISRQVSKLKEDDMDVAADLLSELMIHVNDLDRDEAEEYQDILQELNDMADEITDTFF